MSHPSETAATGVILVVSIIAALLLFTALRARKRSGNSRLLYVAGAFAVFVIKGLVVTYALVSSVIGHEHLELVSSLFDLGVITLLALPLFR